MSENSKKKKQTKPEETNEQKQQQTEQVNEQTDKAYKIKPKRYVILKEASHWEWDTDEVQVTLSFTREGCKPYIAWKDLNKKGKELAMRAVELGLLDFTDYPNPYIEDLQKEKKRETGEDPRFVWNQLDNPKVKSNQIIPKAPQFSNGGMDYVNPDSKAYKLIRLQEHQVIEKLPGFLAGLTKDDAVDLLQEAMKIEARGLNPAMHPRRRVVDTIREKLVELGAIPVYLSGVQSEEDTDSDPNKKTRFAL